MTDECWPTSTALPATTDGNWDKSDGWTALTEWISTETEWVETAFALHPDGARQWISYAGLLVRARVPDTGPVSVRLQSSTTLLLNHCDGTFTVASGVEPLADTRVGKYSITVTPRESTCAGLA